jgi:hypothetical protein
MRACNLPGYQRHFVNGMEGSPNEQANDCAGGFPLSALCSIPFENHLPCANKPKSLIVKEVCHVIITTKF